MVYGRSALSTETVITIFDPAREGCYWNLVDVARTAAEDWPMERLVLYEFDLRLTTLATRE